MQKTIERNELRVIAIFAGLNRNILFIPRAGKEKSRQLSSPEARMYFDYKNRYPSFVEAII